MVSLMKRRSAEQTPAAVGHMLTGRGLDEVVATA